jgi:hypothetical protein
MKNALPAIVALLLAVSYGLAEGWRTDRWSQSDRLEQAAALCVNVPSTIGEWDGADQELDASQIALAKINGYIMRRYVHRRSGDLITVMLLCGRPGPISVHTPDICFQAGGLEMKATPQRTTKVDVAGPTTGAEFWSARFEKPGAVGAGAQVLWSWTTDGSWTAAEFPRYQFARAKALFKLYVIHSPLEIDPKRGEDPELDKFLRDFLPAVQNALFPSRKD